MSCLFNSLSKFVDISPKDLRMAICDYLQTNPVLMEDMTAENVILTGSDMNLQRYVIEMRKESTMGGAPEIRAFTIIFKMNITVLSIPNNKTIEFVNNINSPTKKIIWTGGHYDPVMES